MHITWRSRQTVSRRAKRYFLNCNDFPPAMKLFTGNIRNKCDACKDGIRRHITNYTLNSNWTKHIPSNTDFLVLNMGAWYSYFGSIMNSTDRYEETLRLVLVPAVQQLRILSPKLKIFWMDLPPFVKTYENPWSSKGVSTIDYCTSVEKNLAPSRDVINNTLVSVKDSEPQTDAQHIRAKRSFFQCLRSIDNFESFEWHHMRDKDDLASKYLSKVGVLFLDTKPALIPRKTADAEVAVDGLHWW
jgi:hypothetical protein